MSTNCNYFMIIDATKQPECEKITLSDGFYITTNNNIHNHYHKGTILGVVRLDKESIMVQDGNDRVVDKIILESKHNLSDPNTYKLFGIQLDVDYASANGFTDVLDYWKTSGIKRSYSVDAIDNAAANGHLNSIIWWINSGLLIKYINAIDNASASGFTHILEYCRTHGLEKWKGEPLPLKYSEKAYYYANKNGHNLVIQWWINSGLPIKYPSELVYDFIDTRPKQTSQTVSNESITASKYYQIIDTRYYSDKTFKNHFTTAEYLHELYQDGTHVRKVILLENEPGFKIIKDPIKNLWRATKIALADLGPLSDPDTYKLLELPMMLIDYASKYGYIKILDWWLNKWLDTGIELVYSSDALKFAIANKHKHVEKWWNNCCLKIKYPNDYTYDDTIVSNNNNDISNDPIVTVPVKKYYQLTRVHDVDDYYFTDAKHIHEYYGDGTHIREITLDKSDPDFTIEKDPKENIWKATKVIWGQKYSLADPSSFFILGLEMMSMDDASKYGYIAILDWHIGYWLDNGGDLNYTEKAVDDASIKRRFDVLQWWERHADDYGIIFKYSSTAYNHAFKSNDQVMITWWTNCKYFGQPDPELDLVII